jgi:hypothetical protein
MWHTDYSLCHFGKNLSSKAGTKSGPSRDKHSQIVFNKQYTNHQVIRFSWYVFLFMR